MVERASRLNDRPCPRADRSQRFFHRTADGRLSSRSWSSRRMAAGDERRKNAVVLSRVRRVQRRLDAEIALKVLVAPAWCAVTAAAAWRFVVQRQVFAAAAIAVALGLAAWLFMM